MNKENNKGVPPALDLIREIKMSTIETLSPSDCLLLALDLIASSHSLSSSSSSSNKSAPPAPNVPPPSSLPPDEVVSAPKKGGKLPLLGGLKHRPSGSRVSPHFSDINKGAGRSPSPRDSDLSLRALEEEPLGDDDDDDDNDDDDKDGVWIPRLSSMMLNEGGNFVYAGVPRAKSARGSHPHDSLSRVEDKVMDRNRGISYVDVSSREKREVFQLPAVHRSMRRLNYGDILMSEEVLMLAKRYMEVGPSRASLLHIGFDSLQEVCNEKTSLDELSYISPGFRTMANLRGYHWLGFVVQTSACLCEIAYYILHMKQQGSVDLVSFIALVVCLNVFFMNGIISFSAAFKSHTLTANTPLEDVRLTGLSYARLHGLDILAAAQHRLANATGKSIAPSADLSLFRKRLVSSTMFECMTVHFLIGAVPAIWSSVTTAARSYHRGDILVSVLAAASTWSRLVMILGLAHSSFVIRLSQKLSEFEVRRVEADIRTVQPNLTHRITPRFKNLLHECHLVGNRCHQHFMFIAPALVLNTAQLLGSLMLSVGSSACLPSWTFLAVFQPLFSLVVWIHFFGVINLGIERDIDQVRRGFWGWTAEKECAR